MNDVWKSILKITLKLVVKLVEVVLGSDIDDDGEVGYTK